MKKNLFIAMSISVWISLYAQNETVDGNLDVTGNIGIGFNNPTEKLQVKTSGGTFNTFMYGAEYSVNTQGPWARAFRIRNKAKDQNVSFGALNGTAYISTGFDLSLDPTGYNSQNQKLTILQDGKIGVGTISPKAKLHVSNTNNTYGSILASTTDEKFGLYTKTFTTSIDKETFRLGLKYDQDENNGFISFYRGQSGGGGFLGFSTNGSERLRILRGGNVGIGTNNPGAKLSVDGFIKAQGSDGRLMLENSSVTTSVYLRNRGEANQRKFEILYGTSVKYIMDNEGNVGIGTLTPDEKLSVNGKIHTKEVKVDLNGWSDFVFDKYYELPTLEEVENHITNNGHLIDIPSEKEVLENGILLGEMDAKLLQKIEELTLYTIEQEKQIKLQQDEIKLLSEKVQEIEELKVLVNNLLKDNK